ncbi:putative Trichohyalin [Cyclospora cayetanensis]|uniref:Trichohyalin n=1 Tax=Cyclospora cayetanensis TaxID=88456 RepID=A0A1D3CXH0_9EIME|nr:putative Trichohyalin [Cyclospora cayetanensis]
MKRLWTRANSKPTETKNDTGERSPARAESLPVHRWLQSRHNSFTSEATCRKAEDSLCSPPSTHRDPIGPCSSEHCQAVVARLQHQLQNLKEEKSQLESLISMQRQTLHQIDRDGRTSEEVARRQIEVQQRLALVSIEEKLTSSSDAIQSLNEHIIDLRKLLEAKDEEAEKLRTELAEVHEAERQAKKLAAEETAKFAKAYADLNEHTNHLKLLEQKLGAVEVLLHPDSPKTEKSSDSVKKDIPLKICKESSGDLQEKAEPLLHFGAPNKLEALVTRIATLVEEIHEARANAASLKRQLTQTQEKAQEKDVELESLRKSLVKLQEKAEKAESVLRLGSTDKLESLATRNSELVAELAEREESVVSLRRQLTETQGQAQEAEALMKEKDVELESLRKSLVKLQEKAEKAESVLRLGSTDKLESLATRNVGEPESDGARFPGSMEERLSQEYSFAQKRINPTEQAAAEDAQHSSMLNSVAQEVERRLQQQLQSIKCEHEKLKKENNKLKQTLMNVAQKTVDKENEIRLKEKEFEALRGKLKAAAHNAEGCKYLAQMEKERRIAQVTHLRCRLAEKESVKPIGDLQQHRGQFHPTEPLISVHSASKPQFEASSIKVLASHTHIDSGKSGLGQRSKGDISQLVRMGDTQMFRNILLEPQCDSVLKIVMPRAPRT